jgi:hypothetical protein
MRFEVVRITSSFSSGVGAGVGVGFAFHAGGGGGMSLRRFCACTTRAGKDRKTASTPIRNAGRQSLFSTPNIISDTLEPVHHAAFMRRECLFILPFL